ncbi:MAG: 3-hydroxyacyl-CoA dehydrogenase [Desulfobacteraceae bacterium]|nr:3-hydroxyacyl-CoA dehydrogenase [Desulfobacteraceae bacterium]
MDINNIKTIAVIGAGDMGHGIAQLALMAGYKVYLRDISQKMIDKGVARINKSLEKLESKKKITKAGIKKINSDLLVPCINLAKAVSCADLVIEAIPEIMELKEETFKIMDDAAPEHTLFASNTSTMSISRIAMATRRPEKVFGLHYFNPAVIMKLVEVIRGEKTSDETLQIGYDFALKTKKIPVRVQKDIPGFIVNRIQAAGKVLLNSLLDKKIIAPGSTDAVFRKTGFPMGPFETMDYTGLDVNCHTHKYLAKSVHPDFKLGSFLTKKIKAGHLGKKTGKGIFDWSKGRPEIDLEKADNTFDPLDLVAVHVNEATKIIEAGACTIKDIDPAIQNGMGTPQGPVIRVQQIPPKDLVARLERLATQFNKEIFKPSPMIKRGEYILESPKNILVKTKEHIAVVTIDHPPANAWNLTTMIQFEKAMDLLEKNKKIRVILLTGAGGKCFSAGFDINDATNAESISSKGRILWQKIDRFTKPVIAVINGFAMGGGLELAMCCHFRIMSDHPKNKIGLTELNLGIIPGWGGTQNLARLVGKPMALDMILFGKRIDAKKALKIGLVNRIFPPETLMDEAMVFARNLALRPPLAVKAVLCAMEAGDYDGLKKGWEVEEQQSKITAQSADAREGFTAFIEKRPPIFKGEN